MKIPTDADTNLINDVAAVTCVMVEELPNKVKEEDMPGKYYYHIFNGFPGWWHFCADAGWALHRAYTEFSEVNTDYVEWIDCVDYYVGTVLEKLAREQYVLTADDLKVLAEAAVEKYRYE